MGTAVKELLQHSPLKIILYKTGCFLSKFHSKNSWFFAACKLFLCKLLPQFYFVAVPLLWEKLLTIETKWNR